jgi:hypothetical protein
MESVRISDASEGPAPQKSATLVAASSCSHGSSSVLQMLSASVCDGVLLYTSENLVTWCPMDPLACSQ